MIVTLTPNTGIDHTVQLSSFRLNETLRAVDSAWGMGGKATDVSWILGKLGIPNRALGFAAGANGIRMEAMLRARGTETDFVWVDGETRLNTVLVVPNEGQSTITASSLDVSEAHVSELKTLYRKALESASCVVMGGSLPRGLTKDFYAEAITQAHAFGIPVIFDSSGPSLVAGVKSRPELVKPNVVELEDLIGYVPGSQQEIHRAARKLHRDTGSDLIITLGAEGAIAVLRQTSYYVQPLSVPIVSSAGAGDGVLAGMALAYLRNEPFENGLRYGFALAGAILKTLATADFLIEDYQELLPQICLSPLAPEE